MHRVWVLCAAVLALVVGACGGSVEKANDEPRVSAPPDARMLEALGPSEKTVRVLAPPEAVDVGAFEQQTGCTVEVTPSDVDDPETIIRKVRSGQFDGALGAGDATLPLIEAGAIAPINTALLTRWETVFESLRLRGFNSAGDPARMYAIPIGRTSNQLVYRRDRIPGSPARLGVVFDRAPIASYGGQLSVPDSPHHIAEAALWASKRKQFADLKIEDPYELDAKQFEAVISILRYQKPYVGLYWDDPAELRDAFGSGKVIVGLAPKVPAAVIAEKERVGSVDRVSPREGASGRADGWMISARAKSPNCMYRLIDQALAPEVNGKIARGLNLAPTVEGACDALEKAGSEGYCDTVDGDDDDAWKNTLYRSMPSQECGDDRGKVCKDWAAWQKAWEAVKSG